jgi:hypothetical protein
MIASMNSTPGSGRRNSGPSRAASTGIVVWRARYRGSQRTEHPDLPCAEMDRDSVTAELEMRAYVDDSTTRTLPKRASTSAFA